MLKFTQVAACAVFAMASIAYAQGSGADLYKAKCAMCHGADGAGATPAGKAMKTPSFTSPEALKVTAAEMIATTKAGKGKMPAYAAKLTDPQIKEAVAYIKTLQKK